MALRRTFLCTLVVVAFATNAVAETITADGITYESDDAELIAAYVEARARCEVADPVRRARAVQERRRIEAQLEVVPTFPSGSEPTEQELSQQWAEQRAVHRYLTALRERVTDDEAYALQLEKALERFAGHPAEASVLVALGDLHKDSYREAVAYYRRAAQETVLSDRWGYAQQQALQKLAEVYEQHGCYRKALQTLESWTISEQCGTGAMEHEAERQAWMAGLRVKLADRNRLLCFFILPIPLVVWLALRVLRKKRPRAVATE
jgi:tetratricopeptide (TPR) repeat protein